MSILGHGFVQCDTISMTLPLESLARTQIYTYKTQHLLCSPQETTQNKMCSSIAVPLLSAVKVFDLQSSRMF